MLLGIAAVGVVAVAWQEDVVGSGRMLAAIGLIAASTATAAWVVAETPLGRGDGVMPSLVGRTSCDGEAALEKRGLRWRYDGPRSSGRIRTTASGDGEGEPTCDVDVIRKQAPAPGTDAGEGAVVRLTSSCSLEGCD